MNANYVEGAGRAASGRRLMSPGLVIAGWLIALAPARADERPAGPDRTSGADKHAAAADEDYQIGRLIEDLGDSRFDVRQRSQRELTRLGAKAFDALSAAENNDDVEIATQARYLVRLIRIDWVSDSDPAGVRGVLVNYEYSNEQERMSKLRALVAQPNEAGIPALCRLARFEPSHKLSKQAAALILRSPTSRGQDWSVRARRILDTLDRSSRPAAGWLRTYVRAHDDPAGSLDEWRQWIAAEQETLDHHPQLTQSSLIQELLKQQVDAYDRLGRGPDAEAAIDRIIALERGESDALADLVKWLSQRKDWKAIDQVFARFDGSFSNEPDLLYTLAQARLVAGNAKLAQETAAKALKLNPDKPLEHLSLALRLENRGMTEWADAEYRYLIGLGPASGAAEVWLHAHFRLSEHLHDRLENKEAAAVLESAVKQMDNDMNVQRAAQRAGRSPDTVRARMYFFFAEDFRLRGENAKALESIEKAVAEDPTDVDVLISMYRLPLDAERRKKVIESIHQVIDATRREIQQRPDEPMNYNQLAWLVANTEGDFDEAIRLSQKSIDLVPENYTDSLASYLDTLAHCYYAKKDYASAVKHQTEAAQLAPGNAAIERQLKVFRAALDKQTAGQAANPPAAKQPTAVGGEKTAK